MFCRNVLFRSLITRHNLSVRLGRRGLLTARRAPLLRHVSLSRSHIFELPRRTIFSDVSPFVLVPSVFVGLLLGHWLHKCLLMVLFQNKIIYMPSLPPGSRREKLSDYSKTCGDVSWEEEKIKSLDGTKLTLAIARPKTTSTPQDKRKHVVILYFQGNGASIPPRTPMLSNILRATQKDSPHDWTLVALSYRGYWTSSGRAHQKGIEKDAQAFADWAAERYDRHPTDVEFVFWGQSIGAGVAAYAACKYLNKASVESPPSKPRIARLILETPFVSIKSMLAAIYPDWWVPYKHLWPFLRSWWDSERALRGIAESQHPPRVFMVVASRDEIVPRIQADQLEALCKDLRLEVTRYDVLGALHTQASSIEQGKRAIAAHLRDDDVS